MAKIIKEFIITNPQGLHARPAALVVQIISKYNSAVTVQKDAEKINGKSIMGLLTLGAQKNSVLKFEADGDDAQNVINELEAFFKQDQI